MIKFNELKVGDYVIAEYEGKLSEGEVTDLNGDEKQIEVTTDVQAFWYDSRRLPCRYSHGVIKAVSGKKC